MRLRLGSDTNGALSLARESDVSPSLSLCCPRDAHVARLWWARGLGSPVQFRSLCENEAFLMFSFGGFCSVVLKPRDSSTGRVQSPDDPTRTVFVSITLWWIPDVSCPFSQDFLLSAHLGPLFLRVVGRIHRSPERIHPSSSTPGSASRPVSSRRSLPLGVPGRVSSIASREVPGCEGTGGEVTRLGAGPRARCRERGSVSSEPTPLDRASLAPGVVAVGPSVLVGPCHRPPARQQVAGVFQVGAWREPLAAPFLSTSRYRRASLHVLTVSSVSSFPELSLCTLCSWPRCPHWRTADRLPVPTSPSLLRLRCQRRRVPPEQDLRVPPACTAQATATTLTSHHRWTFLLSDGSAAVTGHVSYRHRAVARDVGLLSSVDGIWRSGRPGREASLRDGAVPSPCPGCGRPHRARSCPAPARGSGGPACPHGHPNPVTTAVGPPERAASWNLPLRQPGVCPRAEPFTRAPRSHGDGGSSWTWLCVAHP